MPNGCWNYRVRKKQYMGRDGFIEDRFDIVEAHYDSHKKADIYEQSGWTIDSMCPVASTVDGLRDVLQMMLKSIDDPIIEDKE